MIRPAGFPRGKGYEWHSMLRLLGAVAVIALAAPAAHAEVIPGDSVNSGIGAAVANSTSRPIFGISRDLARERPEDDIAYRQAVKNIPDRKPSKDPWARIRQAPAASVDRHRVQ
jgi:hypothetical protein